MEKDYVGVCDGMATFIRPLEIYARRIYFSGVITTTPLHCASYQL